jgi:cysteinyl-tRNA synthetase
MVQTVAMSASILSETERESLLLARVRLMKLPPERIIDVQTAPTAALKQLLDALHGDAATVHDAVVAFSKGVNDLCDGALRKHGRVNVSAVQAAEDGFEAITNQFNLDDPVASLRALRDSRAAARRLDVTAIDEAVLARAIARQNKAFDTADRLHRELREKGVVVIDDTDGSEWTLIADDVAR